ncbi:MAG: MFS transporter [Rhodospirillales bacterium]|nr:MFS transporter [Rhodospirillales bacterium]
MRRNVLILATCQALAMTGTSMLITASALVGIMLAPSKTLATLPLAVQFVATTCSTIPASLFMAKVGRKMGFTFGQCIGMSGGAIAAYAIYIGSFSLFIGGCALLGIHNAFWQYYRFAAADVATDEFRARAISYVLAGGLVAAFFGPQMAKWTAYLSAATFAVSFASIIGLSFVAVILLQFTRIPTPAYKGIGGGGRPVWEIMRTPTFMVAAMSSTIGYGVMNMLMTSTPLAMTFCGFQFNDTATVIQWHIVGMFLPSFFTGHVIKRFGVVNVIAAGALLQAAAISVSLSGVEFTNFWGGLIALGVGWNFMFIGGTTLLTEAYMPEERAKTQAAHDFMVFGLVAITAFASGVLHEKLGWAAVNLIAAVPVSAAFITAIWYSTRRASRTLS